MRVKNGYKKGTRYLYIGEAPSSKILEDKIKIAFKRMFNLIAGEEYFSGDEFEMYREFIRIVMKHMELCYYDEENFNTEDNVGPNNIHKVQKKQKNRGNLKKKIIKRSPNKENTCKNCKQIFKRQENLDYHIENKTCHDKNYFCKYCGKGFKSKNSMYRHSKHTCRSK